MDRRKYKPHILYKLRKYAESDLYMKMGPRNPHLIGERWGRLEVVRAVAQTKNRRLIVLCHCDCGEAVILVHDNLKNGVKSCGCLRAERQGKKALQVFKGWNRLFSGEQFGNADHAVVREQKPIAESTVSIETINAAAVLESNVDLLDAEMLEALKPKPIEKPESFAEAFARVQREAKLKDSE